MQHQKEKEYETYHGDKMLACFGIDLEIYEDCNINDKSGSNIGWKYQPPIGLIKNSPEAKSFMAGQQNFTVSEIEVYKVIY